MIAEPFPEGCRGAPRVACLRGRYGFALTVDVEEWYHTCLVPSYVRPEGRPALVNELDRLLPELLETLARSGRSATFFVLGEVAERLPRRVREIAAAGHEVASHGNLHLRASDRSPAEFARDVARAKAILEDLTGVPVDGYRAPEWSLRGLGNCRLPMVAAAGYRYDSSLATYPFAGRPGNPRLAAHLSWPGGSLLEFPPLSFAGPLRLPAGSWTGRLVPAGWLTAAARAHRERGGLPVFVVHPWELSGAPTPGRLRGLARFIHETGRLGFRPRFAEILGSLPWTSIRRAAGLAAELDDSTADIALAAAGMAG